MANVKVSGLPTNGSPATGDYVVSEDVSSLTDVRVLMSDLITLAFNNVPTNTWQYLGSNVLGASGNTLTVAGFTAMTYLQIYVVFFGTGGTVSANMTFNSDSGTNYAYRASANGAADTTSVSQTAALITGATTLPIEAFTANIINVSAQEKIIYGTRFDNNSNGAGNAPDKAEFVMKWANTSAQITTITITNTGGGSYNTGSSLFIFGHN